MHGTRNRQKWIRAIAGLLYDAREQSRL